MSWLILRPQIKTLLEGVSTIQEVALAPKLRFSGYPAAYVIPSSNSGDYETTAENQRVYAFIVRIFYETKSGGVGDALTALEEVVDSCLDAFDEEDLKGLSTRTLGLNLPAKYTFLSVMASPMSWAEIPDEELIMAEITVRVKVSVDIT